MIPLTNKSIRGLLAAHILLILALPLAGQNRPLAAGILAAAEVEFVDSGQTLGTGMSQDVALGDVDGDLDLDAIVVNYDGGSAVWLNDGTGHYSDSGQSLGSGAGVSVALGDLDGDNDLDAFVARDAFNDSNEVWLNQGGTQAGEPGIFVASGQTFGHDLSSAVALADLDGDGDLDAYVARSTGRPDKIWLNDGSGQFSDSGQSLGSSSAVAVALGDVDGDGDFDAFAAGGGANRVWLNDGSGQFADSGQNLGSDLTNAVALSDVDSDGDLDAFTANIGDDRLWLNQGGAQGGTAGLFADSGQALASPTGRDVALADVDGDGDVDAFMARFGGNFVFINQGGKQNGTPGEFIDSGLNLGDGSTEGVALGDVDGDGDMDAFVANFDIPDQVWLNQRQTLIGGTGYFRQMENKLETINVMDLALGDLDGDGDVDALILENGEAIQRWEVWLNDGLGGFSKTSQDLDPGGGISVASISLGDVNGDGDLDAFIGRKNEIQVWQNDGFARFTLVSLPTNNEKINSVALGDLDGDGDLDGFVVGHKDQIFLNDGTGNFTDSGQSLDNQIPKLSQTVALGDLDGDNDLDAYVGRKLSIIGPGDVVYINDGTGGFSNSGQAIGDLPTNSVALADLDEDGDLDAYAVTGSLSAIDMRNQVWLNDGSGIFYDSNQRFGNAESKDVALADLNGDGEIDAVVANFQDGGNSVWLNSDKSNIFDLAQCLGNLKSTAVALDDLDGDGDMDAMIGTSTDLEGTVIWLNGDEKDLFPCVCAIEWLNKNSNSSKADLSGSLPHKINGLVEATFEVSIFYLVRDEILAQNAFGRRYSDLYYTHNREILELLVSDDALRDEGAAVLDLWSPNLQALVSGQGETAVITAGQVEAVDQFLTNLSTAAGLDLQQAITAERANLPDLDTFVGQSMAEAQDQIIGHTAYLPIIARP